MAPNINLTGEEQKLRQLLLDVVEYVGAKSDTTKPQVRFAGGWVRDKLLGVNSVDIDIAVDNMTGLSFASLMKEFASQSNKAASYGKDIVSKISKIPARPEQSKHLETATMRVFGLAIDIANLRKETYSEDSRNPQMEFGTPREDALRRDATVNSLFYNLHDGKVEDLTGQGLDDMRSKFIRTPLSPYQTFKDDPLRVLRCIRFASRLGYTIDTTAAEAMGEPSIRDALRTKISRERIGIEVEKMLKGNDPHVALSYIDRFGLYETIFTDPANTRVALADTANWFRAYDLLAAILGEMDSSPSSTFSLIKSSLMPTKDDIFLAWLLCAVSPSALPSSQEYVPTKRQPKTLAALVAREGLKIDNKSRDVIEASSLRLGEIIDLKNLIAQSDEEKCYPPAKRKGEPISREDLGMKIRDWGPSWRGSVILSILVEMMGSAGAEGKDHAYFAQLTRPVGLTKLKERDSLLRAYGKLLLYIKELNLLNAETLKPVVDGKRLLREVGREPGDWMVGAIRILLKWQFRHPEATDPTDGIMEVVARFRKAGDSTKS